MHVHEESENVHTPQEIWESTLATFFSKLLFSLTFLIPLFICPIKLAVIISVLWGLNMVAFLSHRMAQEQGISARKVIVEHVSIAITVIVLTHLIGVWTSGLVK